MRFLLLIMTLATLLGPTASAAHWAIHDSPIDNTAARTLEDDGDVFPSDGPSTLAGRANRVNYPGTIMGDGGLFLDAIVANGYVNGPVLLPGAIGGDEFGTRRVLLPGPWSVGAWYGWWRDANADGIIDDVHDATADPLDEFVWRGLASGETLEMRMYYPSPNGLTAFANPLIDRTEHANPTQEWIPSGGFDNALTGQGLISSWPTLTLTARPAPGTALRLDIDDPAALMDVDIHEAVNADAETLFSSTTTFIANTRAEVNATTAPVLAAERELVAAILRELPDTSGVLDELDDGPQGDAVALVESMLIPMNPRDAKEPSTSEDDYEGRAIYGNGHDIAGSFNTYSGYLDGSHLYADALARTIACAGASISVPVIGGGAQEGHCQDVFYDPADPQLSGERSSGFLLGFTGYAFLWHDKNADTHVGRICDPETDAFDPERNVCDETPTPWPHDVNSNTNEVRAICASSTAKNGIVTLTPIGGAWPNVVVMRDAASPNRVATDGAWQVRSDSAPITLRFEDACRTYSVAPRDLLWLPQGSDVTIRSEFTVTIAGFVDSALGIEVGAERVMDVDYIPALL